MRFFPGAMFVLRVLCVLDELWKLLLLCWMSYGGVVIGYGGEGGFGWKYGDEKILNRERGVERGS